MNLQAVIMAGGVGNRLRPLTCDLPKPMARLCGRPNIEYILELLAAHGVTDAAVTVQYLPQCITGHFAGGVFCGVRLAFAEETEPLGTAGSVKNAMKYFFEEEKTGGAELRESAAIFVISGDAMCDFDLTAALRRHRESGAEATIVVKAVDDPREYGLVDVDERGEVRAFVEKPCFSQAVSNLANTGVYILSPRALEQIPSHRVFDFAKDLFPKLLGKGWKISAHEESGYWCDIGDVESYRRCQRDMLLGKVRCRLAGTRDRDGNVFAEERPRGDYRIVPPIYVGERVLVGDGAALEDGAVLDDGAEIGAGARVTGSVLLPESAVGRGGTLTGAVLCAGAAAGRGAMLFENAVLGAGAAAGENCVIRQGVRVWAGKRVEAGTTLSDNLQYGAGKALCFEDNGLCGETGFELTAELALRLGLALGSACGKRGRVGVGCTGERSARVLRQAMIAGIQAAGGEVYDFGAGFEALFRFNLSFCGLGLGVFLTGGEGSSLRLFTSGGLPATRAQERAVEGFLQRGDYRRCPDGQFGEASNLTGMRVLYENELLKFAPRGLAGVSAAVQCPNREVEAMLRGALARLGAGEENGLSFQVSPDGGSLSLSLAGRGFLPHSKVVALGCIGELEQGLAVALPFHFPRAAEALAERYGGKVLRYLACPADAGDGPARELAGAQLWSRDALMLCIKLLAYLKATGLAPAELFALLPEFDTASVLIKTGCNPAGILRELAKNAQASPEKTIGEGVLLRGALGTVLASPLKRGGGIRLTAEAVNSETALELCDSYEKLIRPMAGR